MGSLSVQIAARLFALLAAIVMGLVLLVQLDAARPLLFSLEGAIAVAVLAVMGAAALLQPLLLRVEAIDASLAAATDTRAAPLRVPGADAGGDELARIAARLDAASERVIQQDDALARAERRRRDLVANVSHELRTPLAAIQGYLELLLLRRDRLETAEARNHLQAAVTQCERLARLVGDLVELSRLEADDAQPDAEPFALAELAQDVVQKFAPAAQRREITLAVRCGDGAAGGPIVHAEIALIARTLDELVDAALQRTPAGGAVTVEVGADTSRAHVSVHDTGAGAAPQAPALLERIATLHGSRLQIDQRRGEGTWVGFDLERVPPPNSPIDRSA